jgi:hypothetical protein
VIRFTILILAAFGAYTLYRMWAAPDVQVSPSSSSTGVHHIMMQPRAAVEQNIIL